MLTSLATGQSRQGHGSFLRLGSSGRPWNVKAFPCSSRQRCRVHPHSPSGSRPQGPAQEGAGAGRAQEWTAASLLSARSQGKSVDFQNAEWLHHGGWRVGRPPTPPFPASTSPSAECGMAPRDTEAVRIESPPGPGLMTPAQLGTLQLCDLGRGPWPLGTSVSSSVKEGA